eukprot:g26401.t1
MVEQVWRFTVPSHLTRAPNQPHALDPQRLLELTAQHLFPWKKLAAKWGVVLQLGCHPAHTDSASLSDPGPAPLFLPGFALNEWLGSEVAEAARPQGLDLRNSLRIKSKVYCEK